MTRAVDPIRMEVFRQRIIGIAEEMGMKMKRAAFSTIIKEREDLLPIRPKRCR